MSPYQKKKMIENRKTLITAERKRILEALKENGYKASAKETTARLRRKYDKMQEDARRVHDSVPNRYKSTDAKRNRAKYQNQKK